jgi:molybdopterin-guanine dinucleotide biosynthesis protein A
LDSGGDVRSPEGLLGAVLAGGEGRRFGADKALALLYGRPLAAWALDALAGNVSKRVVISGRSRVSEVLGVPVRADTVPGAGPLGGLLTALEWAREEGRGGVFLLACDLPLVSREIVGTILEAWPPGSQAVVPESEGPLGAEPLCAGYGVECLSAVERLLEEGELPMEGLLGRTSVTRVEGERLGSAGALRRAFTNVNTPGDARRAEELLRDKGRGEGP